jgi:hypothetical protein
MEKKNLRLVYHHTTHLTPFKETMLHNNNNNANLSKDELRMKLRKRIQHAGNVRAGKTPQAMPNPEDLPPEMRPHMDTIADIHRILGPISTKKSKTKHKPEPKKQYQVNAGTIFQQHVHTTPIETPKKTISFLMPKVVVPQLCDIPNKAKVNISSSSSSSSSFPDKVPFTSDAIQSIFTQ